MLTHVCNRGDTYPLRLARPFISTLCYLIKRRPEPPSDRSATGLCEHLKPMALSDTEMNQITLLFPYITPLALTLSHLQYVLWLSRDTGLKGACHSVLVSVHSSPARLLKDLPPHHGCDLNILCCLLRERFNKMEHHKLICNT